MIITATILCDAIRISFANIECILEDEDTFLHFDERSKLACFAKNMGKAYKLIGSTIQFDTVKGVTSYWDNSEDILPLMTFRTDKMFERECNLTRLINMFATGKKQIRF